MSNILRVLGIVLKNIDYYQADLDLNLGSAHTPTDLVKLLNSLSLSFPICKMGAKICSCLLECFKNKRR